MISNLLLIIFGIVICFGGIVYKKLYSGLLGALWGFLSGITIVLLNALNTVGIFGLSSAFEEPLAIFLILFLMCLLSFISIKFEKLCATINAFFNSLFIYCLLFMILIDKPNTFIIVMLISLLLSSVTSFFAFIYHDYAYVIVTSFIGGFLASLGFNGILNKCVLNELLVKMLYQNEKGILISVLLITIILGCIGAKRQFLFLNRKNTNSIIPISSNFMNTLILNISYLKIGKKAIDDLMTCLYSKKLLIYIPLYCVISTTIFYKILMYTSLISSFIYWNNLIVISLSLTIIVYITINEDFIIGSKYIIFLVFCNIVKKILYSLLGIGFLTESGNWLSFIIIIYPIIVYLILIIISSFVSEDLHITSLTITSLIIDFYIIYFLKYLSFNIYFDTYRLFQTILTVSFVIGLHWFYNIDKVINNQEESV